MDDLVRVRVRDCPNGSHPDGDFAYLKPRPDLDIGFGVNAVIGRRYTDVDLLAVELGKVYLRFGIAMWDLHDDDDTPWALGLESLGRLDWSTEVYPMADRASDLYASVFDPLVASLSKSSANGLTGDSTLVKTRSTSKRRKH